MKTSILTETHRKLGAKMVDFAGFEMPLVYTNLNEEHQTVRNVAGMFDVSHMGEFIISGENATMFLDQLTSNDPKKLKDGQAQYSCLPNEKGGIIDDMILYKFHANKYMMVVNASNIQKDWNWIQSKIIEGVELEDISDSEGLLAIQGPKATEILQNLTDINLNEINFYHFGVGKFAGIEDAIISATGYTGAGGFEIYVPTQHISTLWNAIMKEGEDCGLKPIGLGARDTLRLEMGYCLYGNDITDETSPIEAGLSWITKIKKRNFPSSSIFSNQKKNGVVKKLVGFKLDDRRVPRNGYKIFNHEEANIGMVTSGTMSPSLNIPIGMGYVDINYSKIGTTILIDTGRKKLEASICTFPFYINEK